MFKRVEKILNSIGEGITICDANLRHVFSNARFGEMTGLDKDAQGVSILEHYPGSISDTCVSVEVVRTRKQYTSINTYNNGVSLLSTGVPVFDDDGNLQYVVTISRNITELVRQEASVHGKQQNKTPMTVQKFISNAANIRFAIQHMDKLIGQRLSVLLLGETGTGKDYFAKFLHENAYPDPENRPFIKINCGAIPESLLESELFGYEKGAFTGASAKGKKGLIELANNGTLFLDEIGELPYNLQAKLLGVLQDKELTRVGGSEKIKINAKIISASNRDIFKMTQENKFRLDLYYRISMVTLHIPPLRERREDIPYLIDQLLREINQLYGKKAYLSLELYDLFFKYDWPGNIRELKNLMEKLIIFSSGDRIGID
ncbi:MAG: sigma-54 interaction domain-containing protein, partial [Oscillospiraceae bacterium]